MIVAGDIGGTNCRLACYDQGALVAAHTYASREFDSFEAVVLRFVDDSRARPTRACFAMAGPVRHGVCRTTNLPWPEVDERSVAAAIGASQVRLVNDFAAQTVGVTMLRAGEYEEILGGAVDERAAIAVLGAGTGLGEAFALRRDDGTVDVLPGEGGHADFAPTDERQIAVLRAVGALLGGRVSYEQVLSGPGLLNVYRGLERSGYGASSPMIEAAMLAEADASAVISREGLAARDPLCAAALEVFVEVYAQEASNMALRALAFGGVYLAGGIAPKIVAALRDGRFERRFRSKSPHERLLAQVPVRVVLDTRLGLRGAARIASELRG
jgi:glucokinase